MTETLKQTRSRQMLRALRRDVGDLLSFIGGWSRTVFRSPRRAILTLNQATHSATFRDRLLPWRNLARAEWGRVKGTVPFFSAVAGYALSTLQGASAAQGLGVAVASGIAAGLIIRFAPVLLLLALILVAPFFLRAVGVAPEPERVPAPAQFAAPEKLQQQLPQKTEPKTAPAQAPTEAPAQEAIEQPVTPQPNLVEQLESVERYLSRLTELESYIQDASLARAVGGDLALLFETGFFPLEEDNQVFGIGTSPAGNATELSAVGAEEDTLVLAHPKNRELVFVDKDALEQARPRLPDIESPRVRRMCERLAKEGNAAPLRALRQLADPTPHDMVGIARPSQRLPSGAPELAEQAKRIPRRFEVPLPFQGALTIDLIQIKAAALLGEPLPAKKQTALTELERRAASAVESLEAQTASLNKLSAAISAALRAEQTALRSKAIRPQRTTGPWGTGK
ncbi:MAG: hypothetical protein NXI31_06025 [bacterium]|nr:hypothetical protein [bacterium]